MTVEKLDRITQSLLALHDFGTREGATHHSVKQAMMEEGFTLAEIAATSGGRETDKGVE